MRYFYFWCNARAFVLVNDKPRKVKVSSDPMQVSVALNPGQKACTSDQKVWFIISLLAGDVHQNIDQLEIFLRILAICQLQIRKKWIQLGDGSDGTNGISMVHQGLVPPVAVYYLEVIFVIFMT